MIKTLYSGARELSLFVRNKSSRLRWKTIAVSVRDITQYICSQFIIPRYCIIGIVVVVVVFFFSFFFTKPIKEP